MAESLGNTGPSGSVLRPAMELVLVLVDPAHNKAFIPAQPGPIQLGMEQCRLFGCCLINSAAAAAAPEQLRRGAPVPALFGVPILVTSPGVSPSCPTLSMAGSVQSPGLGAVWVILIIGIKFPSWALSTSRCLLSAMRRLFVKWRHVAARRGLDPLQQGRQQGRLQPVPGSDAGSCQGTVAFSVPNHPQGPSALIPPCISWVPNPCVLHPPQPARAKQARSWFVIPAWIIPCKQVGMI